MEVLALLGSPSGFMEQVFPEGLPERAPAGEVTLSEEEIEKLRQQRKERQG